MFTPPPTPPWEGLHVIAVHWPIALLLTAPLLVVMALLSRKHGGALGLAALVVMAVGAGGAWLAVMTGEAAEELLERSGDLAPALDAVLHEHEELGETARTIFLVLTGVYGVMQLARQVLGARCKTLPWLVAHAVFLAGYAAGSLVLVNAAHEGGRLVHEFGVRAPLGRNPASPTAGPASGRAAEAGEEREHADRSPE